MKTCSTCKHWARGSAYTIEPYGYTPARWAWSASDSQKGECRIAAPYKSNGVFPVTFEFQGCAEHSEVV